MADGCCVVGALAKLAIGGTRLQFIEFDPMTYKVLSDGSIRAIRGRLDHDANNVAEGLLYVGGRISLYQTAQNMAVLLPILGLAESPSGTFTLGDTLASTTIILGINGCPEVKFMNSFVGKIVFRGVKGADPPRVDIWFMSYDRVEQANGTFFVSQTNPAPLVEYPYAFAGGTLMTFAGAEYAFNQYALGIDRKLVREFNNSVTATNICPTDNDITIGAGMLYATCQGTVTTLVTNPFEDNTVGGAFSLAFERTIGAATYSTTFHIGNVKQIPQQPGVPRKNDLIRFPFNGRGYAVGTAPAMYVVNDAA